MRRSALAILAAFLMMTLAASVVSAGPSTAVAAERSPMAFASKRTGNSELYLRDATGTEVRLTQRSTDEREPALSPDGSKVAYSSNASGDFEIYVAWAMGWRH